MANLLSAASKPRISANLFTIKRRIFVWLALLLVALAILRSIVATRLDGFTIDEAYHITAGVSYVKYHDFRINPDHPPLVKLWVGSVLAATGFRLDSLRNFNDKQKRGTSRIVPFIDRMILIPSTVAQGWRCMF